MRNCTLRFDGLAEEAKAFPGGRGLPFEYDGEPAEEVLTAYSGIPQLVRAARSFDVPGIESWKREAKPIYDGNTGYQPMPALWAERDLVVADEFRDANVGAHTELVGVTQRALAALPETVEERYFRGDSACYEQTLLKWLRSRSREEGRKATSVSR